MANYREHDGHGHDDGAVHVHVHPMSLYIGIFLTLIVLTVVTVATSYIDIDGWMIPGTPHGAGGINLALAMVIATTKAAFVVTWFMHLKDDNRFNALVFLGSTLFVAVFLAYTMNDTAYRGHDTDPYQGVRVLPTTGERAPGGLTANAQYTNGAVPGEIPEEGIEAPPGHGEHAEGHGEGGHEEAGHDEGGHDEGGHEGGEHADGEAAH